MLETLTTAEADERLVLHEAVGIFDDEAAMMAAVDDLLEAGFGRCELSFAGKQHGAQAMEPAAQLADDPLTVRTNQFSPEVLGDAEGSLIGGFAIVPAFGSAWAAGAAGAGILATTGLAVVSGGMGAVIGLGFAMLLARRRHQGLTEQIGHGGLLLWVRTRTETMEVRAKAILARHAAHDVHSRELLPLA